MPKTTFLLILLCLIHVCFTIEENVTVKNDSSTIRGDMILTGEQEEFYFGNRTKKHSRTGLKDTRYRWPKYWHGFVLVPYIVDSSFCKFLLYQFKTIDF